MNDRHRPSMHFLKFLDVFLLVLAFGLSTVFVVRADRSVSLAQFLAIRTKVSDFLLFGLALFLCHLVLCLCGLYKPVRVARRRAEIANVLPATALCVACFVALGWVFFIRMITLQFLAVFWALSTTILCAARQFLRLVLDYIHLRGRNLRYMLILGTNPRAAEFARRLLANRNTGYRLLGFVDDEWEGTPEFRKTGFQLVSHYAGLADFLRHNVVDEVAFNLPFGSFYSTL